MSGLWGTLLGWFAILGIGVPLSIALHELGHMVPAKKFGVACSQYMIGFGPTIWSRKIGETEYGIKAIPLGGYVRMLGMLPPKPGRPAKADSTGRLGLLIDRAREDAQLEIGPEHEGRLFYQKRVWQRLVILLCGPLMNLVLATAVLGVVVSAYGLPELRTQVEVVNQCVIKVSNPAQAPRECTPQDPKSPAAAAGLLPNDRILSVNGKAVSTWDEMRGMITSSADKPMSLVVDRGGKQQTLTMTPIRQDRPVVDDNGVPKRDAGGNYVTASVGYAGLLPRAEPVKQPLTAVPGVMWDITSRTAGIMLKIPEKMVGVAQAAFSTKERDPNGPISVVGVGRVAGDIGGVQEATMSEKIASWASIIAALNVSLFVFNLIPLLPLDGGHMIGAAWEAVRRRIAKLRSRPDPGPVDVAKALPVAYAVGTALIAMSVLLIYADIFKPIKF